MCNWAKYAGGLLMLASLAVRAELDVALIEQFGRQATEAEVAAWDIDVRPDFAGLPEGSGSVEEGETLWLEKCALCHGDFGDSNEVFSPLVLGNVTPEDMESGRVASLQDPSIVRTTLMKVATVSTLWDYINRAMPWNAPKSLSNDEVYALVAYLLNLGYMVDYDFVLSNDNIGEVQAMMPNRNGMTRDHGLWDIDGQPDVLGSSCAKNCDVDTAVSSFIPDYAMNAHGNLADQVRDFGPFPGIQTAPESEAAAASAEAVDTDAVLGANGCLGCHKLEGTLVGPAFVEVQKKYAGQDAVAYLTAKIREGGAGVWGSTPMPAMPQVSEEDLKVLSGWLAGVTQ